MPTIVLNTEDVQSVEIPAGIDNLAAFRRWALSKRFPERGRIDYICGRIEVDISPEEAYMHGSPKVEIVRVLANALDADDRGHLFVDQMRVSSPDAELSCEPDLVFVSYASLESGRVRMIPAKAGGPDSCLEFEGGPDFVVEVVSRSSVRKDTRDLFQAYYDAGVQEYWLIDALGEEFRFQIFVRGRARFVAKRPDADGFQRSAVWGCDVQMLQRRSAHGTLKYKLLTR